MKSNTHLRLVVFILLSVMITLLLSCAALQEFTNVQKPRLNVSNVRVSDISFEDVLLSFDIDIENPNALSATMSGFDYDLLLAGASFVKGQQTKEQTIESMGKSTVEVPVRLNFKELYSMYQSLKNQDSTNYTINTGFTFNLPILGATRIPISHEGKLPLLKLPNIKVSGLQLKNLSLTGANLELKLNVDNPNVFNLILDKLQYDFKVNKKSWVTGVRDQALTINQKKNSVISIPISLNFLQMGSTVYNIVSGNESINYSLNGNLDVNTSLPLLKQASIPIDMTGKLNILK
ncbi:LEA type 2 family protein [candidate division KSB1 bacterium]|nr:LEA type 2 family protein [candidate division KSB1 bacterium]